MFNPKAKLWIEGREATQQLIKTPLPEAYINAENRIWFHCSSLGEFEQARPLIEALKQDKKNVILLTFFSPSGYEIRKDHALADIVCYLPNDTRQNAVEFIKKMRPTKVYWTKYDFWLHHISELKRNNIPVFLFSAIFRKEQIFFQFYGRLFRELLKNFSHVFVQDKESIELLKSIGINNAAVANDTRFDRVIAIAEKEYSNQTIDSFVQGSEVIVAGSTWPADERSLLEYMQSERGKKYKYIVAPHNLSEALLSELERSCKLETLRYSKATNSNVQNARVLIIDNIGMLSNIYRYGKIAYVGGGFGASVHNVLEAAVYGIPVLFGPNHKKSRECSDLIATGGALSFSNQDDMNSIFLKLEDDNAAEQFGGNAKNYVYEHSGGTEQILSKTNS